MFVETNIAFLLQRHDILGVCLCITLHNYMYNVHLLDDKTKLLLVLLGLSLKKIQITPTLTLFPDIQ